MLSKINQLNFPVSYVLASNKFPFPKNPDESVDLTVQMADYIEAILDFGKTIDKKLIDVAKNIYAIMNVVKSQLPFPRIPCSCAKSL